MTPPPATPLPLHAVSPESNDAPAASLELEAVSEDASAAPPPAPTLAVTRPTPYLIALFALAVLYTMRVASTFLIPIVVALLLNFLFSPVIRRMNRRGISNVAGAAIVTVLLFGGLGTAVFALSGPAAGWVTRAPTSMGTVETRLRDITAPFARLQATGTRIQEAISLARDRNAQQVTIVGPSLVSRLTRQVASLFAAALTIVFLTFFLLASGELFITRVIESIPLLSDKKKAVRIARDVEEGISRYLATVAVMNTAVGFATWGVLAALGMPNAPLWGAIAAVMNFIPYIGAILTVVVIAIAALASFESISQALMMPLAFLVINTLEANLVTPMIMRRQFPLNSVAIFIGLVFWYYIWGIPGALLAVPLMVTLNVCCMHIEMLRPYGAFLRR